MLRQVIAALLVSLLAASMPLSAQPAATPSAPPEAIALWTISSDDCIGVDADGEPWQVCGVQAFDMNADASRTLTVSVDGIVQLRDGEGVELRRVEWRDHPSGASGYPNGVALIAGDVGVVVAHHNQLLILDLADGRILAQKVVEEAMDIRSLVQVGRGPGRGRIFAEWRDRQWRSSVREILLPSGEFSEVPGMTDLMRVGPTYWMNGSRPPFTLHREGAEPADIASDHSCMPLDEHWCTWRDIPGSVVHLLDVEKGIWRDFDLGRTLDGYASLDVVPAGGEFYAIICERAVRSDPPGRPCSIIDLATRRVIHRFEADGVRAVGAVDEQGRPEIRLQLAIGNKRSSHRIALDGSMRPIDPAGRANLAPPGGGILLPGGDGQASILVDVTGRSVASFPFPPASCGFGWPSWREWCRFSADGRKWLVSSNALPVDREPDTKAQLTLYALPPSGD